jgi:hypothetical protein
MSMSFEIFTDFFCNSVTRLLQHCYSIVTNVTRVENEMKISQIIVTHVTGCYKCYSTSLENGQKSELIKLHRCYKVVT